MRPDPGRYALDFAVCQEMGWSWSDLQATPFDFVEEIIQRMTARNHWHETRRKLDEAKRGKS